MDLRQNYFELFGLQVSFDLDSERLALAYRELQRATHPDRFAHASAQERRIAMQLATRVNEAYAGLREPLARAKYLLEILGAPLPEKANLDPMFLMEQMELREQLGEVRKRPDPFAALDQVRSELEARERVLWTELGTLFSQGDAASLAAAAGRVHKLQFLNKLLVEAGDLEEELVHSH